MKLYTWGPAPNPRRVRIYLKEKGLEIPLEEAGDRAQLKASFLAQAPQHRLVPLLELDDGTSIGEAMAICRYLEALHPAPPLLFGSEPRRAALIDMWERKCEFFGIHAVAEVFRNVVPAFADRSMGGYTVALPQLPELVKRGAIRVAAFYDMLDAQLARNSFVAGDAFSVADITALCAVDFAAQARMPVPDTCPNVRRWHAQVSDRPSTR
jgi:glutathione S-transferase